jgi:RNA polymerase sigma-70 factor (ECF subfamily)
MQATSAMHSQPSPGAAYRARLAERLGDLRDELGGESCAALLCIVTDEARDGEALRDAFSTALMERFRLHGGRGAFGLLYELNAQHLLVQVAARLRRYGCKSDPLDVLQEVFFNVYRYPHRFDASRDDAFRVWSAMIVRNTVLKHLRSVSRRDRGEVAIEDLAGEVETQGAGPLARAVETESNSECARVYLTYLQLYLAFYALLSERERRALQMVEVEDASYRQAAEELGIKLENLKMVVFRARRKIQRAMRRAFDGALQSQRPAQCGRASLFAEADDESEDLDQRSTGERGGRD